MQCITSLNSRCKKLNKLNILLIFLDLTLWRKNWNKFAEIFFCLLPRDVMKETLCAQILLCLVLRSLLVSSIYFVPQDSQWTRLPVLRDTMKETLFAKTSLCSVKAKTSAGRRSSWINRNYLLSRFQEYCSFLARILFFFCKNISFLAKLFLFSQKYSFLTKI